MTAEILAEAGRGAENLPNGIREWYRRYADSTWKSIDAMIYPRTGLPADQLHYHAEDEGRQEKTSRVDKTSPTNIGFSLACTGAATAMGFITSAEAGRRIDRTLATITDLMQDPEVFIPTGENKGLFINWIQPSTGKVLRRWPGSETPVKQQVSTVDNAWLIAFSKLISAQFPQYKEKIQCLLDRIDLPFMLDNQTGFFHGCYALDPPGFESWQYNVISEARIAYLICGENPAQLMGNLINHKSERSVFVDSTGKCGRATWDGELFECFWPQLVWDEGRLNPHWGSTSAATVQMQKDYGTKYNGGHYGYSAGLDPNGQYREFRVPDTGESEAEYMFQPVVTISALVSMGLVEPVETHAALQRLHREFPHLTHIYNGDGDTVNTQTGAVQRDQLLPNQATSLMTCWNIVKNGEPRELFMGVTPASVAEIYKRYPLW